MSPLPPETLIRIARAIIELTQDETEEVTVVYPNPDVDGPNNIIYWSRWVNLKEYRQEFSGDSLVECLEKAVAQRREVL